MALQTATKQPLTSEKLREQLGRLGRDGISNWGNAIRNGRSADVAGERVEPHAAGRREQLDELRRQPKRWTIAERSTGKLGSEKKHSPVARVRGRADRPGAE